MSPPQKVVSFGAILIIFAIALTLSVALRRYNTELAKAAEELRTLDILLATEAGRSLQSVELVLENFTDQVAADQINTPEAFADQYASEAVHDTLRARVSGVPQLDAITIVNASGKLINFSRSWPIPDVSLADRDFFRQLREDRTAAPILSEPILNRDGVPTIYLVRRVSAPDGAFLGLVLGAIELKYFEDFYRSLRLGPGNLIALWRSDGMLLARYPPAQIGLRVPPSAITSTEPPFHHVPGVFEKDWSFGDSRPERRIVATQEVAGFPVQVNFARSRALILGDWWREFVGIGTAVALAVICLVLLIWALIRRIRAYEAVAAASLEREKADLARREAEDALRQAQKMEAVGQLTGGVAHDFNNLLTVVQSSLDLLRRPHLTEERRVRYIDAIEDAAGRAVKLTGQLLAFARRQSLKPQVFDANDNVAAVGDLIDRLTGSRVLINVVTAPAPCLIEADPNQFDTSLVNLAVNARDAMANDGHLTVAVKAADRLPATPEHPALPGSFVAVSVSDTGSGIPPELLGRVFEPFFTTKQPGQGTGLGLSQVFGFAKQSGGDITVESVVGQGTTVTLFLPRILGDKPTAVVEPELDDIGDGEGRTILVVEDSEPVARAAIQTLIEFGYGAEWVQSAEAAMERLQGAEGAFDLVFSDVMMQGMNGIELGRLIRTRYARLPVVLTSGYSDVVAQEGPAGFPLLQKPYSADELARMLKRAFAQARKPLSPAS